MDDITLSPGAIAAVTTLLGGLAAAVGVLFSLLIASKNEQIDAMLDAAYAMSEANQFDRAIEVLGAVIAAGSSEDRGRATRLRAFLTETRDAQAIVKGERRVPPPPAPDIWPSVEAALRSVAKLAYEVPPRILITGSLYLAGHVLAENGTLPQ